MRLAWVQHEIDTAPVVVGALSDSGYTPPDTFGHGTLIAPDGFTGWVIFDRPHVSGQVEKVCAQSVVPPADVDVDFLHIGGEWIKLRTGRATLTDMDGQALTVEPETTLWRGAITSDTAFAVRSPDLPYRLKILLGKLRWGHQSPLDYLRRLRLENPSCAAMPEP